MARYSKIKISELLVAADKERNSDTKGDILEQLVKYIFAKVKGVKFHKKNVLDSFRAHELDVTFKNDTRVSELYFLDYSIITECKNTKTPVGSKEVRWFADKLRDCGKKNGILISLNGISGAKSGNTHAHSEILNALTRDSITVLLITREDLKELATTNDLADLLHNKILSLTIERTVS
jgi:hypothetical protein